MCSCIVLDEEKSRQNCYTTSPAHLATFYFSSRYLISRLIFKPYPWANRPEYNEKSANLQHYQQPCYSFWRIPSILRVVSERNDWKKVLFKLFKAVEDALQYIKMSVAGVWTKTAKGYFKNVEEQVIRRQSKVWSNL